MELRPYQQQAKDAIFSEWENGIKKTLLVLPTGCGKTIVFAKVAEECVKGGSRVLILAHRGELLDQAADKIGKSTGLGCATEKAEQTCLGSWFRIVVGSVQSMMREKRLNQFPNDYFNTIIIDEAHHCISDSYQKVLRHFPDAEVLGVTATPDRGDMQNLGTVFESLAYEYTLPKAIKEGYLSPIKAVTIPLSGYVPAFGWEMAPPSDGQKKTLEKLGILPDAIENAGKASKILDRLDKRRREGLTTPKQIRFLESRGFQHVGTWQFETAKNMIDRIAGNGWRVPSGIIPAEYRG